MSTSQLRLVERLLQRVSLVASHLEPTQFVSVTLNRTLLARPFTRWSGFQGEVDCAVTTPLSFNSIQSAQRTSLWYTGFVRQRVKPIKSDSFANQHNQPHLQSTFSPHSNAFSTHEWNKVDAMHNQPHRESGVRHNVTHLFSAFCTINLTIVWR